MNRRQFLSSALALTPRQLHEKMFVSDAHLHVINRQLYRGGDIGQRVEDGHFDLVRAKEGGLDALFFTLFITEDYYPGHYETKQALRLIDLAYRQVEKNARTIGIARNAAEIQALRKQGRMAAVLDLEGGFDMDGDLGVLRALHQLGVRSIQLPAHNFANNFADSCCAITRFNGLTAHGRAVVAECNRLGIVINIAHASTETAEQAIAASEQPVVSTHDGLRSRNNIPRLNAGHRKAPANQLVHRSDVKKDRAEMTIAEVDKLVGRDFSMTGIQAPEELKYTTDQWFEVVERATAIAGEDHVMLGTDFDGGPTLPRGMRDCRDYPMLTEAMLRRGWKTGRIEKFLGGNLLRVFGRIAT